MWHCQCPASCAVAQSAAQTSAAAAGADPHLQPDAPVAAAAATAVGSRMSATAGAVAAVVAPRQPAVVAASAAECPLPAQPAAAGTYLGQSCGPLVQHCQHLHPEAAAAAAGGVAGQLIWAAWEVLRLQSLWRSQGSNPGRLPQGLQQQHLQPQLTCRPVDYQAAAAAAAV